MSAAVADLVVSSGKPTCERKNMTSKKTKPVCPHCGSDNVAKYLWGYPAFDEKLEQDLKEGRIVLGGCCLHGKDPEYHCNQCGCDFGSDPEIYELWNQEHRRSLIGVVYGAAVGDALGVPFEFKPRDSFVCDAMVGHGTYDMPAGTFSDDTSLLLATADSLRVCGGVDIADMRQRFCAWLNTGAYTPDGVVFDVGNATATALTEGRGCEGEHSNGNGSLMRIAPLAFSAASDQQIEDVSAITHAHEISRKACVAFVRILKLVLDGTMLEVAIAVAQPDDPRFAFMAELESMPREEVRSSGYVLDTLGAALWCALHTDSYRDCVLEAVNLGSDTDTTACVAGALAGALYGLDAIPDEWIATLRGKDVIDRCLFGE